jgi:hypothetical protein
MYIEVGLSRLIRRMATYWHEVLNNAVEGLDTLIALDRRTKDAEQRCVEAEAKAAELDELTAARAASR